MQLALTICSANYLAFAKSMADSLVEHNPAHKVVIVLLDHYNEYDTAFFLPHTILPVASMQIPELAEMNARYNTFELSCALKPFAIEYFLNNDPDIYSVYYFDADILVYNSLEESDKLLATNSIVLTPHIFSSILPDGLFTSEEVLLRSGVYNAGFIGVSRGAETFAFLSWWKQRLLTKCFNDMANGLFVDQLWLNFVPLFFLKVHIIMHPGYNVAYWNYHERSIDQQKNIFFVNQSFPLVFHHYSGFDIYKPDIISIHQNRHSFNDKPAYRILFDEYINRVLLNNHEEFKVIPTSFGINKNEKGEKKKRKFFKNFFR